MSNQIPHNHELEQAVLGAIIEDNQTIPVIASILKPESFYTPAHQHIFRAMLDLTASNMPIDEVILGDKLQSMGCLDESGGYAYMAELVECVPMSAKPVYYARLIQEDAVLRNLIEITNSISKKARDPQQNVTQLLSEAQQKIIKLSTFQPSRKTTHIKETFKELFHDWQERTENPDKLPGIPTGLTDLDQFTGGLIAPALWVVAARPKMGKTAFAMNIVENVNLSGEIKGATLIFSLEMSKKQIANRTLTSNARVDNKKVKFGKLEAEDWNRLAGAVDTMSGTEIYINKGSRTITEVSAEARLLNLETSGGVGLVVVDYLQLMKGSRPNMPREQEIAEISRELKGLAMELDCPVIALSQLNRDLEKRGDKRPILSDLRESGAIEQDADIILFIYRDEVYNENSKDRGTAEIIIGGHREGPTGTVFLSFQGKFTKFDNLSKYRI